LLSNEPLNDRISATSVTSSNTIRRRPDSHGPQHRRLRGLSNNRTVMQARRTVRETTGSSVGWSAIVVVFSATARAMPARLMSMPMPVAGDGVVAGGRSGVVVRPAGTGVGTQVASSPHLSLTLRGLFALTGTPRSPPDRNSWRTTWSSVSFLKPVAVTWIPSLGNPPTTRLALSPTRLLLSRGHFRSARLTSVTLSDSHQ
jgi:hypothetical protein